MLKIPSNKKKANKRYYFLPVGPAKSRNLVTCSVDWLWVNRLYRTIKDAVKNGITLMEKKQFSIIYQNDQSWLRNFSSGICSTHTQCGLFHKHFLLLPRHFFAAKSQQEPESYQMLVLSAVQQRYESVCNFQFFQYPHLKK